MREVVSAAQEAFSLARLSGCNDVKALEVAIEVALREEEQAILERVALKAGEHINDLDATAGDEALEEHDRAQALEQSAALKWFSAKILEELPSRATTWTYTPTTDDYVEVVIRGDVEVMAETCLACGNTNHTWWCVTTAAGDSYDFALNSDIQVRRITSA